MNYKKEFWGEFIGIFIIVLFGCGSVSGAVLFDSYQSIFQIGVLWGLSVTLTIYATRSLSCAHLNPAVSIAMAASGRMSAKKLPCYLTAQFSGAFFASLVLYLLFNPAIVVFEQANGIIRGTTESMLSAKMFGEYYQLPGSTVSVSMPLAMAAEALGTFF